MSARANFTKPWAYKLFFLKNLPLALVAGLEVKSLSETSCEVSIKYGWRNTNPFGSMYFAAQAMASELSTGALGMIAREAASQNGQIKPPAMLVSSMNASFVKPARGLIVYRCENGAEVFSAVNLAMERRSSERVLCKTIGRDESGAEVSTFEYEWWFSNKDKKRKI